MECHQRVQIKFFAFKQRPLVSIASSAAALKNAAAFEHI
jgi:hypothetical protein